MQLEQTIRQGLNAGIMIIHYRKKDGTQRKAVGTTNPLLLNKILMGAKVIKYLNVATTGDEAIDHQRMVDFVNQSAEDYAAAQTMTPAPPKEGLVTYYDLDCSAFRSFSVSSVEMYHG